jgi:Family of unknown function (DUF6226)
MPEYARPTVAALDFRDESGATIRYGSRWGGPPPDDSYSRVSNPQRFAPVLTIADVLIEHLRIKYRAGVVVLDESSPRWVPTTTKLIGVTPDRPDAAPLLFRYTDFPGIEIWAGLRYSAAFPSCGCDACDETWERAAGDIELLVFAVTEGRFGERITLAAADGEASSKATVEYTIQAAGAAVRSGIAHGVQPDAGLRDDAERLSSLPGARWQPWRQHANLSGG